MWNISKQARIDNADQFTKKPKIPKRDPSAIETILTVLVLIAIAI